ncbi:DUF3891 family protein [Falsiroseomonas oryziterrae]|uniref:DUF3891 family protein n=1 Tax=Falsiroseomonas oryziterrae TaxID=2911368 RepID=UPI001F2563F1|nr:DUF3891 family protein [Roseomonas sp. NPKOSM-4]
MLFRDLPDGSWLAVSQPMHALVSGQMLRAWGAPDFAQAEPFEEVATACAQHDVAWMGWEAAPTFDPATGRPTQFRAVGARDHAPMWAEGVRRALASWGPWVALLVSRHGSRIYASYQDRHRVTPEDAAAAETYQREQVALRAGLMRALGVTEVELEAAAALVAVTDALSLAACGGIETLGWSGMAPLAGGGEVPLRLEEGEAMMTVDPWPFAVPEVALSWTARRFGPGVRFKSEAEMRAGLADAPVEQVRARLVRR